MALPSTEIQTARDGNLEICILSEDIRGKFQNKCKKKRGRFPDQWLRCLGTLPDSRFLHFCLKQTIQDRYWGSTGKPLLGPPVSLIVQLQFRPFSCLSSFLLIYVGKAQLMTKVLGPCHPCGRSRQDSWLLALIWPISGYYEHLHLAFQINEPFKNNYRTYMEKRGIRIWNSG